LLANRRKRERLAGCRQRLDHAAPTASPPESATDLVQRLTGIDLTRCPVCRRGRMTGTVVLAPLAPTCAHSRSPDTS
jgi:hypothetical protein